MRPLHQLGWLCFWLLALASLLVLLTFLWFAIPAGITIARGGWSRIVFAGHTGYLLAASVTYLLFAFAVLLKRRPRTDVAGSGT